MTAQPDEINNYASVLTHAPVLLRAKTGDVPTAEEAEGLYRVGKNSVHEDATKFGEAGPDAAQFLAVAIAPFVTAQHFDRDAFVEHMVTAWPPVLGDGGRSLEPEEAERVADVCKMLRVVNPPSPVS